MKIQEIMDKADAFIDQLHKDTDKILAKARKKDMLLNYSGEDRVMHASELSKLMLDEPEMPTWDTGHLLLNNAVGGGISPQQLISITGITKNGKSSFARHLMQNFAERGLAPCVLSFEETPREIIRKELKYKNPVPNYYIPGVMSFDGSFEWIENKVLESILKFGTKVILIDHLHFIVDTGGGSDRFDLKILQTVKALKHLSQQLNIAIFLICHLRKVAIDKNPDINDVADSRAVAQWSDKVWCVWREGKKGDDGKFEYNGVTNLAIQADRQSGENTNIALSFDKGRYTDTDFIEQKPKYEKF